ncbi:zinc finger protein 532-like [Stegodyphus dumicola]|uniref:zinc finger protein 532-like n=1 Tax=Stegodyphus dumicola TaxID=202533 RepID=UPI0015AA8663|nr:zinc finger protein 532-like [Stegodyphus dumicola]
MAANELNPSDNTQRNDKEHVSPSEQVLSAKVTPVVAKRCESKKENISINSNVVKFKIQCSSSSSVPSTSSVTLISRTTCQSNIRTSDLATSVANNASEPITTWKSPHLSIKQNDVSDMSFKGDNLQQLSTNALPPYRPGSPPGFLKSDSRVEFHYCTDCGDAFAVKDSLKFHLERRSVLIKFPCDTCKTQQVFYNRCNLLSHIRSHSDKGEAADISKATVSPLPRVCMDGINFEFVNNLDDELNAIDDTDLTPPADLLEFSIKEIDDDNNMEKKIPEKENDVSVIKVKCLDCNEEFESAKDRIEHLTNGDKIPAIISQCSKCGMVCPSKCSLKAHQRIHLQISPYVCPECGDSPDPHWTNFTHHVNFKCFHNARSIGYKCPVCKRVSPSNEALLKHMELHTERYAKCESCPRAYMTTSAFEAHNTMYHGGKDVCFNLIYKCSLCDIVFLRSDQMLTHRSAHLKEQICEYVFNCMQCGKTLGSKTELYDHIRTTHPKIYKVVLQNETTAAKSVAPTPVSYRGKVECMYCHCVFHSHQGYSVHIQRVHININQPCTYCYTIIRNRKGMIIHGKKHLESGKVVCLLCNNAKYNDKNTLDAHLVEHIENLEFCTFCPICDSILPSVDAAKKHLREEHRLIEKNASSSECKENEAAVMRQITCHFCRIAFVNEESLQDHLKLQHNIGSANQQNNQSSNNVVHETVAKKRQSTEGNTCSKCNYHSTDREDFKKHILSHKTVRSSYQCQECAACYIVEPTLLKHLLVVHKIDDPKKYVAEEGTNYLPEVENPTEISTRNALECSVCFTTFPNEIALKTHLRSHGMAFIQATKTVSGP